MEGKKTKRNINKSKKPFNLKKPGKDSVEQDIPFKDGKLGKVEAPMVRGTNDISWYLKNPQMAKDVASLSFNNPVGLKVPSPFGNSVPVYNEGVSNYFANMMAIEVVLCPGKSTDAASPANVAANNVYSYVRYQNSGAKNYDQADLMLYLLAMDSIYACWNWLKRMYGYIRRYEQANRTVPKVFADADGIDLESFSYNLADFRAYLNLSAAKISAFNVPSDMSIFLRHSWMFSNIYKDASSVKAQYYMFKPMVFHKYAETASQYGGKLEAIQVGGYENQTSPKITLSKAMELLDSLLNAISYSEDIGVISGDIKKAYGDRLFTISDVDPDYTVEPVYNEEVLTQIHNLNMLPIKHVQTPVHILVRNSTLDITQDPNTGFLKWNPGETGDTYEVYKNNFILNSRFDDVTPENVIIMTRLTAAWKPKVGATGYTLLACGTEVVSGLKVFTQFTKIDGTRGNSISQIYWDNTRWFVSDSSGTDWVKQALGEVGAITQFDWHPIVNLIVANNGSPSNPVYVRMLGDINNYTFVDADRLEWMHLNCVMSEFNVPYSGNF